MNKKGAEKLLSVYWFAILIMVAGGIVGMVYAYYQHPYDVRDVEGVFLMNKISDCLSQQGKLNSNLFLEDGSFNEAFSNDFLKECSITFDVEEDFIKGEEFYFYASFFDASSNSEEFKISKGNTQLIPFCNEQEIKSQPRCVNGSFYASGKDKEYYLDILTIVKKSEKNVKQ